MLEPPEILLVEDNSDDAELALHALRKNNLADKIHRVRDGEEALAFICGTGAYSHRRSQEQPDLILLDLKLPKIDGLEVLQRLKSDPRTRTIPVVIMTSSNQEKDIIESYQLGVNSYIVKPVDYEQFSQAMHHLAFYWLVLNQSPRVGR